MSDRSVSRAVIVLLAMACLSSALARDADRIRTAVIVYGLDRLTEEAYQRILTAPEVEYVLFQQTLREGGIPELTCTRAAELAAAGKRNMLQIWWGPTWPHPWSKYSFANIALDEAVREDFWREVVDYSIDTIGPENLYGAHLMEETGMQFAVDVQFREDPDDFDTFEDNGRSYDHPFWSGWKKEYYGKTDIPNVIRHEDDFRELVGFGFEDDENWQPWQWHLFNRWVSTRLQSGGQVEFAKHIHERYPGLKAFNWDGLLWGGENPRTNHHSEAEHFDGVILDAYGDPGRGYMTQRAFRLLYPEHEIIHISWGGMGEDRQTTIEERRQHVTAPYIAGHNVIGFWSSPANYTLPEKWAQDTDLLGRLQALTPFEHHPRLLIISARISDIYSLPFSLTCLSDFDIVPIWEAWDVDLSGYDTLILDTTGPPGDGEMLWDAEAFAQKHHFPGLLDYRRINAFIEGGGAVIMRGRWKLPPDCPLFPVAGGHLHTASDVAQRNMMPLEFTAEGWWAEELGLSGSYSFGAQTYPIEVDSPDVRASDAAVIFRHGEGACMLIPYHRNYDREEPYDSEAWLSHRRLMGELVRGFLRWAGRTETLEQCIADPAVGRHYRRAVAADGSVEAWMRFGIDFAGDLEPIALEGTDLLTGERDPVLTKQGPAAVLRR